MDKSVETVEKPPLNRILGRVHDGRRVALGIFAKEPVPGKVKTRLCPPLTAAQAARLYRTSLEETVTSMLPFSPVIFYAGERDFFRRSFPGLVLVPQAEGDLGRRMSRAFIRLFETGAEAAALIGSDSPDLAPRVVAEAFDALKDVDVVTSPCVDGGYALIGERRHCPQLFQEIPWSTSEVLSATRRRIGEEKIPYREICSWDDFDDIDSLHRLLQRSPDSLTAACARTFLGI